MTGTRFDRRLLAILYILSFVLLREWLLPVMELTDTNYLGLFLLFVALAFLMGLARLKWWVAVPVKIIYIIWIIHYIYMDKILLSVDRIIYLLTDLLSNVPVIASGDWENITNPFRTFLFFSLLWMTTYLIRHWIEVRKSILLFYIMTVVFIASIDTFSPYSADGSIFIIMVTGLLLLGLLAISRLAEKHNTAISTGAFITISVPLLFVVVMSGTFATLLPKQGPIWPDPVPYVKSIMRDAGEGGFGTGTGDKSSGYGKDDSKLGGSFVQDDTLVFEAKVNNKQYWKIETKNTYTSKGWEQVSSNDGHIAYSPDREMGEPQHRGQATEKTSRFAHLTMVEKYPFILYPYGMKKVITDQNVMFHHLEEASQYKTLDEWSEISLDSYEIEFVEPDYSLKELRATSIEDFDSSGEDLTPYLQLPEQLPDRVRVLAKTITESHDSVYEKTKAIEKYFARNGFVYAQQDVAIPNANEDYVDQFLFDTKRGYCDNFSTSMVVMLRAIDIPARWVKGFAPGEYKLTSKGERVYQITNNEAHSWVEAYLPGIGWMPFEPTIGFSNLTDIEYDIEFDVDDPQAPEMNEQKPLERKQNEKPVEKGARFEIGSFFSPLMTWVNVNKWFIFAGAFILMLTVWSLYLNRVKWLPKVLIFVNRSGRSDWETFAKRYKSLLKQLDRFGLNRSSSMTLTDYAVNVDSYFGGDRMRVLTAAYEKGLYGGNTTDHEWASLKEMWEDLINRTSG